MKHFGETTDTRHSGLVSTSQVGVHPHLGKTVRRHLASPWAQPLHRPTVEVFRNLEELGAFEGGRPMILDSGCGTGHSTQRLAESSPHHLVIGVDQSLARLGKSGVASAALQRDNYVLVRAELATFWRLFYEAGHAPQKHYLLYPNPWPKPGHLKRRWHAHPVFPWLLALGGEIELRCNWEIYTLEFAAAVEIATGESVNIERYQPGEGISPFEVKYLDRGHALWSVSVPTEITQGIQPII